MQAVPLFKRRTKAINAHGREPKGPAARRNKKLAQLLLYIKAKTRRQL